MFAGYSVNVIAHVKEIFIQHIVVRPLMRCVHQYEANIKVF